jgi:hypothetical protein
MYLDKALRNPNWDPFVRDEGNRITGENPDDIVLKVRLRSIMMSIWPRA